MEEKINLGKLEYLILNFAIRDRPFWLKVFDNIKPEFFEKKENSKIFKFFKNYFKEYNQLPDVQITETELRDIDPAIITDIYADPDVKTKDYIYSKTLKFIKQYMMREALLNSINYLEKDDFDSIDIEIKKVVKFNLDTNLGVKISDIDGRYERIRNLETEKVPTGFPMLDSLLHGGWSQKELYACAAPPGIGKSIFLANWAVAAIKQGLNALVYTLEISEEKLSMRHDAILTKIPSDELLFDIDKIKEKYKIFAKTSKANMWVKEFPTKGANVNLLKAHYEQLLMIEDFKPDVIFIDYAGLMVPSFRKGDSYDDLKTIYEDLRGWAVEISLPIITAAQTNRKSLDEKGGTKEIITQAQISESLGVAQTLDMFMTITQSRTEKEEGIINLYIDKHRSGESGSVLKYSINYKNFILEEYEI